MLEQLSWCTRRKDGRNSVINDSGYFNADELGMDDQTLDICINSAGHYNLITQPFFETLRPAGRVDVQLLYIAKGTMSFEINHKKLEAREGDMVYYRQGDRQHYIYEIKNKPDVYWVHFTGSEADKLLKRSDFDKSGIYTIGPQSDVPLLMQKMIQELQLKKSCYHEVANLLLRQLLELLNRYMLESNRKTKGQNALIEKAIVDFHQLYRTQMQINQYAKISGVSSCWFIRCFRTYTGKTPVEYLTEIRMSKAKELLYSSSFTIGEIAQNIGYQDALYFSRIFKKAVGLSPQNYQKQIHRNLIGNSKFIKELEYG